MASPDTAKRHSPSTVPCFAAILLFFSSLLLLFSSLSKPPPSSPATDHLLTAHRSSHHPPCDYSAGAWVRSPDSDPIAARYSYASCRDIFKGWNCVSKPNAVDLLRYRWQPRGCHLPFFDPLRFLRRFRNANIGFVGDSLNRNMFVSLVCMLRQVAREVRKWRPAGADRGFTFVEYNVTVAYHRTNLLARYGRWWAPSKFDPIKSPMLFFEKGMPVLPPITPEQGLDMTLKHMISYVEKRMRKNAVKFFRTQSPRHFEGGDWNQGGSCRREQPLSTEQVEELFSLDKNGTNVETRLVNKHLFKTLEGSSFRILDITHMSEFRADAHPSTTGGKKHEDCMHWCLPGLTDSWNDILVAHLESI